ncbi:lymphocyte cytosolic protein 2-like [Oppia nitens]|uniref:lymphocyte cytosolic protein 2-like n=1 Tax=Oppia nitens TaxID=1686743 RepID=UPI0023D9D1F7|nr:lymphocyte cytosolic protein 2-like [Oppia nitens]XP_054159493.1 lymphocyte cytosolic protein 2-like [Oppia nitens]XP_054161109.1 lymphocyte cytosolic protein 2-like [Oppia nitens]
MPKLPSKDIVIKWSNDHILQWLYKEDLHDCIEAFKTRKITGDKFLDLSDDLVITFSELKIIRRRQIVKCINECKTQANNAKKLVENIKDHKHRAVNRTVDEEDDDDVGWGSDFDDDSDENDDLNDQQINDKSKTCISDNNVKEMNEDLLYEPVSDYMSNGSLTALNCHELRTTSALNIDCNINTKQTNGTGIRQSVICNTISQSMPSINTINDTNDNKPKINSTVNSLSSVPSPKPSPRLLPKPATIKPEVPKNKPQIIPRKPVNNNLKSTSNMPIKRPPSEPPPPPLPKSPPPMSPINVPSDLQYMLTKDTKYLITTSNGYPDNYEAVVLPLTEDEYLSPIPLDITSRKSSSSTISSLRDDVSSIGSYKSHSSQSHSNVITEENYEPFIETIKTNDINDNEMTIKDENYEIVNENQFINNPILPVSQRPLLPKVKESSIMTNKSKLGIPDVFPNLLNRSTKDKKWSKESKSLENDINIEDNNNNSNSVNSLGISSRPLPPLPSVPSQVVSQPSSQLHSFASNESLHNYEWFLTVEREDAEALLMTQEEDGAYLVRESKRAGKSNPYTLTIFHNGRVFHLNIRKRPDSLYALGKEKSREKTFKTVADLVSYHTTEPILLTTRGTPAGKTRLIVTPSTSLC